MFLPECSYSTQYHLFGFYFQFTRGQRNCLCSDTVATTPEFSWFSPFIISQKMHWIFPPTCTTSHIVTVFLAERVREYDCRCKRFQIFIVDCWNSMVIDTLVGVFLISRVSQNKSALLDINPASFSFCWSHKENSLKS